MDNFYAKLLNIYLLTLRAIFDESLQLTVIVKKHVASFYAHDVVIVFVLLHFMPTNKCLLITRFEAE